MLKLVLGAGITEAAPLDTLAVAGATGAATIAVRDGQGREYASLAAASDAVFTVGGALGTHAVEARDADGRVLETASFRVDAQSRLEDSGPFGELFDLLHKGMLVYDADGTSVIPWRGRDYRFFVPWVLDNIHTAKGMLYFNPSAADMIDMFRPMQRADGMMWSRTGWTPGGIPGWFDTIYGPDGYILREGPVEFVRQPPENHVEYLYVNLIYLCWKSSGDDAWMVETLDSAMRALDYSVTDRARYSERFGLLKRAYTIDSWDFLLHDEYFAELGLGADMRIDSDKTKFGVFYGDNTGYIAACSELAEMLAHAGRTQEAAKYEARGEEMLQRLNTAAWNGRFFTHHVEEDPSVKRDLGVDESSQISLSNCYSLNRGLPHDQCKAILETYLDLKRHLPPGSPAEWYAIYPPFERGFGDHNGKWQYMNGGLAGHAAGELARGALEHGYEGYGAEILASLLPLIKAHGNRLWFAYTGAFPEPPAPQFAPISLASAANMDLWDKGADGVPNWVGDEPRNDLRGLPVGSQTFAGIPWQIADPDQNGRRAAVSVSLRPQFASHLEIPIGRTAGALYFLHTIASPGASGIAAAVTFCFQDGSEETRYLFLGQHLTGWWYPDLHSPRSGVAWRGSNPKSTDVGLSWCALDNPYPDKPLRSLRFDAALDGAIYALAGLTLSDVPHYVRPSAESGGGPDNWAAGTAMAGLVEGLVGVTDLGTAYAHPRISPRWTAAGDNEAQAVIRYAASDGYVAYNYRHDPAARRITLTVTGSGAAADCHVLLPAGVTEAHSVQAEGVDVAFATSRMENSAYADFALPLPGPCAVVVQY